MNFSPKELCETLSECFFEPALLSSIQLKFNEALGVDFCCQVYKQKLQNQGCTSKCRYKGTLGFEPIKMTASQIAEFAGEAGYLHP